MIKVDKQAVSKLNVFPCVKLLKHFSIILAVYNSISAGVRMTNCILTKPIRAMYPQYRE